jgi:hypothetical protein
MGISIISYGKNSLDLRPTRATTSPRERIEFASQGSTVVVSSGICKEQNIEPQRQRGLRRWSAAARLLGLWVRIPPGTWMAVCCECCAWSGRGLCNVLITRAGDSYRLCSI